MEFDWDWDRPVGLALAVRGGIITGEADGRLLFSVEDDLRPLSDGAVALAIETGALSTMSVAIRAA